MIDPRVGWVRDPFLGMAFILSLMAEEKKPFSQLVAELPRYAMLKTKFEVPRDRLAASFTALEKQWPEARVNREDGLRLDGPDWWLHVRGSNTEPVVRVIAEAPTEERARELCDSAGTIVTGKSPPVVRRRRPLRQPRRLLGNLAARPRDTPLPCPPPVHPLSFTRRHAGGPR